MGHALAYRPFADAVQDHNVVLGPMNREELARAIAEVASVRWRRQLRIRRSHVSGATYRLILLWRTAVKPPRHRTDLTGETLYSTDDTDTAAWIPRTVIGPENRP